MAAQKLDGLLQRWDRAQGQLAVARVEQATAEALGRAAGAKRAPTVRAGCCGCLRPRVDAVEHYSRQVPPAPAVAGVERARRARRRPQRASRTPGIAEKPCCVRAQAHSRLPLSLLVWKASMSVPGRPPRPSDQTPSCPAPTALPRAEGCRLRGQGWRGPMKP